MLSSCWLTSPFTGCFNTDIKAGLGYSEDEGSKTQPAQTRSDKAVANGTAGGRILPVSSAPKPQPVLKEELKDSQPRKSKSMGRIHGGGGEARGVINPPTVPEEGNAYKSHRRVPSDGAAWRHSKALEREQGGMDENDDALKRTYKSEYRKKFRPFSQYQYIDGKFQKAKHDEVDGSKAWYKEVLELRRQAGQYRCRGWGVETANERMTEIYSKQVELWEQVSRRSSLQALSLATSAAPSRPISKAEKEIENSRRSSPLKHIASRPYTAPSKPPKAVAVHKSEKVSPKATKDVTPRDKISAAPGRSVSVGPENRSPKRISRPPSSHAPPPSVSKNERRPRPTSLTASTRRKDAQPEKKQKKAHESPKRSDIKSKEDKKIINEEEAKKTAIKSSSDALKDHGRKSTPEPRFDPEKYEPVVKTPPEPTRVKSPDQFQTLVKSPDPVNWTVPLDTGKTFTVTHNVPEGSPTKRLAKGEGSRYTPSSDHKTDLRSRQTPEPTKIYQGSIAGTPITTAGTVAASQSGSVMSAAPVKIDAKPNDATKPAAPNKTVAELKSSEPKKPESSETKPLEKSELDSDVDSLIKRPMDDDLQKSFIDNKTDILPSTTSTSSSSISGQPQQDPMTMSVFGTLNGVNGKSNSPSPTKSEAKVCDSKPESGINNQGAPSAIRRLDDPLLSNDLSNKSVPFSQPESVKSAGYRVLEAPDVDKPQIDTSLTQEKKPTPYKILEAPTESPMKPNPNPYRVLEAPSDPHPDPKLVGPSSTKSVTEALDSARNRFDNYWSGNDKEPSHKDHSNV